MGWIIAGAIVAFLLILLMTSVKVRFEYSDELRIRINWLFITLVRIPAKTKKQKRRNKKSEKAVKEAAKADVDAAEVTEKAAEKSPQKTEDKPDEAAEGGEQGSAPETKAAKQKKKSKLGLEDILELVKLVWDSLNKPLKRLLKATRIYDFRLSVVCGGDDAAKAALNYGRVSAAAGAGRAFLEGAFTLVRPQIDIGVDFMSEHTEAECSFTAKLTPMAVLAFAFWVVGRLVKNYMRRDKAKAAVSKLRK